jgi:hypothetical protein
MTEGRRSAFEHKSTKVAAPAGHLALDGMANRDDDAFEGVLEMASVLGELRQAFVSPGG